MSIPTHNLYDFVHQATKRRFWLMYFYHWGNKNLENLIDYQIDNQYINGPNGIPIEHRLDFQLLDPKNYDLETIKKIQPILICHDQEPLDFDFYSNNSEQYNQCLKKYPESIREFLQNHFLHFKILNLNMNKSCILLHSELNSKQLKLYENTGDFIGAYWWSHALISRDWYRYAEFDKTLSTSYMKKLFLIYCRDTTGSRQYRKTFLELIQQHNLIDYCQIGSANHTSTDSSLSAVYNSVDYNCTGISLVLETVFDHRIHLTEKTLRPLACGHPFILAAGPGSLSLLRKYGFKTFSPLIDESYDLIKNDRERLFCIVQEMKRLSKLSIQEQTKIIQKCQEIAVTNKQHFFSNDFLNKITQELELNVENAFKNSDNSLDLEKWWEYRKFWKKTLQVNSRPQRRLLFLKLLRQHRVNKSLF